MSERIVIALTGNDRVSFLQGLVTNDVTRAESGIIYTALLTPQGKFIADFFVVGRPDCLLLDVDARVAATLLQRLSMYRLRANVDIAQSDLIVSRGSSNKPDVAFDDPRHPAMGWRHYGDRDISDQTDWNALKVAHLIPTTGVELTEDSYILETNFEAINGVDFKKGCFVGQEIVARMKHKTTLKKGICRVVIDGTAATGDAITSRGKPAGVLGTIHDGRAIAYLRFDRADDMQAGAAKLRLDDA